MGVLEAISEKVELNSEIIEKCDQVLLNLLISKEMMLSKMQKSVAESSKSLKELRVCIEAQIKKNKAISQNLKVTHGNSFNDFELCKAKFKSIKQIMAKQENVMKMLSRILESEMKQFETSQRETENWLVEICLKEGNVCSYHRNETNEREISLMKRIKEVETREALLASRQAELIAKQNALDEREKNLALQKELDSLKTSQEKGCRKFHSIIPTTQVEGREKQRRRIRNTAANLGQNNHADHDGLSKRTRVERAVPVHYDSESGSNMELVSDSEQHLDHEVTRTDSCSKDKPIRDAVDYSKSLPNGFAKKWLKECFAVGQTWACYDTTKHKMPRLYVRILKVVDSVGSDFMLHTSRLLPCSDWDKTHPHEGWKEWNDKSLPLGCGEFQPSPLCVMHSHRFSHQMHCEELYRRFSNPILSAHSSMSYRIYPRKGEIWALYQNWNIKTWVSNTELFRNCGYEIVEVLESYHNGSARVAYLEKMHGYSNVFQRRIQTQTNSLKIIYQQRRLYPIEPFTIERADMLRFSHKIPFSMSTQQLLGLPYGTFDLDLKAMPPGC